MRDARSEEQLAATVAGSLAAAGLLLAAAGLLGVTLYAVARRTREFGVRVAMGARPGDLARIVLLQAAARVAIALPLGWALAFAGHHALEAKLYGVVADDTATLMMSSGVVAAVAALAALQPALRAARTDPIAALREE
jgi:ABC-type antimicrobial peptide transport system permease subunit